MDDRVLENRVSGNRAAKDNSVPKAESGPKGEAAPKAIEQVASAVPGRESPCPRCGTGLMLSKRLWVGETVRCGACGTDLEVADPDAATLIERVRVEALDRRPE